MFEQVFISYRRDGGDVTAKLICESLKARGYSVFYDVDSINRGHFDKRIFTAIEKCDDFIIVLSRGALDKCRSANDWVRWEIRHALKNKKNIVPVLLPDFNFPTMLPADIKEVSLMNGVTLIMDFFDSVIDKLTKRMISAPTEKKTVTEIEPLKNTLLFSKTHIEADTKTNTAIDTKTDIADSAVKKEKDLKPSFGLKYEKHLLKYGYTVRGLGRFKGERLVIPSKHMGKPVIAVDFRFYSNDKKQRYIANSVIKEIVFPQGLEEIGIDTFSNFNSVERITLPSSLTKINAKILDCAKLKEIIFRGSIEEWNRIKRDCYLFNLKAKSFQVRCCDGTCTFL